MLFAEEVEFRSQVAAMAVEDQESIYTLSAMCSILFKHILKPG
jgi:hypothetical protein